MVQNKTYLVNLVVLTILWSVSVFDYYLINFQMKHIRGNLFLNSISSSIFEVIALAVGGLMAKFFGTKRSFIGSFALTILGSLLIMII